MIKKTDEMDRKECRKMMKTNKGRRWKMKKSVGWGVCMKQFICGARPPTTTQGGGQRFSAGSEGLTHRNHVISLKGIPRRFILKT